MASVNKVILMGNCGRDPEMRYMPDGKATCNISIATSTKRKDKNTGETIEDTQWHRVQFYDRLAEIAGEYVKKGKPVYIEGRLKYGKYTDQAGVEKSTCDIVATELQLLGGRDEQQGGSEKGSYPTQRYQQNQPQPAPAARPAQPQRQAAPMPSSGFDDMDDPIPFISSSMFFDSTTSKQRKMKKYDY